MDARASTFITPPQMPPIQERRSEPRELVAGLLWMIDNHTSTILRCLCVDVSRGGMRLRVPENYGVREGQRYELTSHLPGQSSPPGLGLMVSRRAEVVRTQVIASDDEYNTEIGVELAMSHSSSAERAGQLTAAL